MKEISKYKADNIKIPVSIGDTMYVTRDMNGDSWNGKIVGITELLSDAGGRMITVHGPDNKLALINA